MQLAPPHGLRTRARRHGVLIALALSVCVPRSAAADETPNPRVVVIEQGPDPLLDRVRAEIEGLGFVVLRSQSKDPLETVARAEQAAAAIRVLASRQGVEVWMADATSGRSLLRQTVVDESPQGPDRDLIALQTAELLRTSLLGDKPAPQQVVPAEAPPHAAPAPAPVPVTNSNERHDAAVQLALGALYSPGGASAAIELGLSGYWFFAERWGVALDFSLPLHSATITGVEGSAKLGPYFGGASVLARFQSEGNPLFATAGVGAAVLLVSYEGEAHDPLQSSSGSQVTAAAYLRAEGGFEATRWFRFGLRALVGATFQRISVTFAGNDAGSFGPVFFAGFGFAEIAFL